MSGQEKKHLTETQVAAILSLVRGLGIELPNTSDRALAKVYRVPVENFINELEEEIDLKKKKMKYIDDLNNPQNRIGVILKGARLKRELSQAYVAENIEGLTQGNLSFIEKGERAIPKEMIKPLSDLLGITQKRLKS